MTTDNNNKVQLSPKTMVDSVAEWPLYKVVEHLKRKEADEKQATIIISCRSAIKSLITVLDDLARQYGVSRNRMSSWLSYHGLAFAREDSTLRKLVSVCDVIRQASLLADDTDTIDMMNSLLPYSPRIQEGNRFGIAVMEWVDPEFEDLSRVCGVYKYQIIQIFLAKSILSDDTGRIAGTAARLEQEVSRWDRWMGVRLGALEGLVK